MSCQGNFTGSAIQQKAKKLAPFGIQLVAFEELRGLGFYDFVTFPVLFWSDLARLSHLK